MKKILSLLIVACFATNFTAFGQASLFSFSQTTGASMETITAPVVLTTVVNGNTDDGSNPIAPAGFTFNFNGINYTQFLMNTNAWVKFGNTAPTSNIPSSLTSIANTNGAFAFGRDANLNTSNAGNATHGPAAGGKYVFQWNKNSGGSSGAEDAANYASFQIVLWGNTSATPGKIEIIYGIIAGSPASNGVIGIVDANGTYMNAVNGTNNDLATKAGGYPVPGTRYTFLQPSACIAPTAQPTALGLTAGATSIAGSVTVASPVADKYLVVRTPGGTALNTMPADAVTYTAGSTLGNGTIIGYFSTASFLATGLSSNTAYTLTLFSTNTVCSGGPLYFTTAPLTGLATTTLPQTYTWVATAGSSVWSTPASWSPARNFTDPSDMLEFSNGGTSTATGINTETVGRITVRNNTAINLQAAATAILTIASDGTATNEFSIEAGSNITINSPAFALTLTYSGTGSTGNIAGTAEVTSPATGTVVNTFGFTGGTTPVTTVTATGVLSAGQSTGTGAAVITATAATLIINGTYNHKFQIVAGTIPTATWNTGSKVNITGYNATVTAGPGGFNQTFYDLEWNCPSQTTNIACAGSNPNINGTFTITSTGASGNFLSMTATTAYTKTWANFVQTGGVLDLATGSLAANAITIPGTFNQSGGTFKSSGTSTSSTTLNFSGTTTQNVTFTGQPAGPIIYRVSAVNGIVLYANVVNFVVGSGTLGGIRISTTAATPVTFGGSITAFQFAATGSTLTYDAAGSYSMTAREFPATNGPANLAINVLAGNVITMPASFSSRSLSPTGANGVLTMTSGDLDINSNTLTLGTSATFPGTLNWTAGSIRVTTGSLTRWFGTTGLPTSAGTAIGYFPLGSGTNNRNVSIYFNVVNALSTGGTITIGHTNNTGLTAVSIADGAYTIQQRTNSFWTISQSGLVATGTISSRITGGGLVATTGTNLRLMQLGAVAGTFVASSGTSPNFQVTRTGLTLANITQNQYIGANTADLSLFSIVNGDWESPATWSRNAVPTLADVVTIMGGTTVTVNATPAAASTVAVNSGGLLTVSGSTLATTTTLINSGTVNVNGGSLTTTTSAINNSGASINVSAAGLFNVTTTFTNTGNFTASGGITNVSGSSATGVTNSITTGVFTVSGGTVNIGITDNSFCNRTFTNNGTFTVSSGTINMYGNIVSSASSFFNQSGGDINIDGNASGVAANSVASGTTLLQFNQLNSAVNLTGGTLTIVDPHASTTASYVIALNNATAGTQTSLPAHTTRFGNGVSTDAGGNAAGFGIDPWSNVAYLSLGSVIVNGPAGTNRDVTNKSYLAANGNVTVNTGGHLNLSAATYGLLYLGGDMEVNAGGTFTNSVGLQTGKIVSNTNSNLTSGAVTVPQTIAGTGTFQNALTGATANFSALQEYNSSTNGVTFGTGIASPTVSGAITITTGKLNADSLSLQAPTAQLVSLTAATSSINVGNFTLSNSSGATLSGLGKLNVTGSISFGGVNNATLNTGGLLVLKSSINGTARVADITNNGVNTGNSITGNVTVERYIPDDGHRAWRLLSAPTTGQTIQAAWQEGDGTIVNNLGTLITSPLYTGSNGFDASSGSSSILQYVQGGLAGPSWASPTNTNATQLSSQQGWMLFVQGDRNATTANSLHDATTLRNTGTLKQGNQAAVTVSSLGDGYTLVGNPYASPIDFESIAGTTNLAPFYYMWNANPAGNYGVGGFRLVERTGANTYQQTPQVAGGTVENNTMQYIHSGEAFFLKTTGTTDASVVFTEASKATQTSSVNPFRQTNIQSQLVANLMLLDAGNNEVLADGIRVRFDNSYSPSVTGEDIIKMTNFSSENLGLTRDGKTLIVEKRPEIVSADTLFFDLTNTTSRNYRFQISAQNMPSTLMAYLVDNYLGTQTVIDLSNISNIDFSTISGVAASYASDRFKIVFRTITLPITLSSVKAYQKGSNIAVEWKVQNEAGIKHYEVEKSADGMVFGKAATQVATGNNYSTVNYNWLDVNAVTGNNYYRIRGVEQDGQVTYSQVVKVTIGKGKAGYAIYPNPMVTNTVNLQFINQQKGTYTVRLLNNSGQLMWSKNIAHDEGSSSESIEVNSGIARGNYLLEIISPDNSKHFIKIIR